jgi:hypothetical protein
MNKVFDYYLYTELKKNVLSNEALCGVFLFDNETNYACDNSILVFGSSEFYGTNVRDWCNNLSELCNLDVYHIPGPNRCNEEFIQHLHYILSQKTVKAVIINCQPYKNFLTIRHGEDVRLTNRRYFSDYEDTYTEKMKAFFHFLQSCIFFTEICEHYNTKLILLDLNLTHTGVLWRLLRFLYFKFNKNTTIITGDKICDVYLKKIAKTILKR